MLPPGCTTVSDALLGPSQPPPPCQAKSQGCMHTTSPALPHCQPRLFFLPPKHGATKSTGTRPQHRRCHSAQPRCAALVPPLNRTITTHRYATVASQLPNYCRWAMSPSTPPHVFTTETMLQPARGRRTMTAQPPTCGATPPPTRWMHIPPPCTADPHKNQADGRNTVSVCRPSLYAPPPVPLSHPSCRHPAPGLRPPSCFLFRPSHTAITLFMRCIGSVLHCLCPLPGSASRHTTAAADASRGCGSPPPACPCSPQGVGMQLQGERCATDQSHADRASHPNSQRHASGLHRRKVDAQRTLSAVLTLTRACSLWGPVSPDTAPHSR